MDLKMKILSIETSGIICGITILEDKKIIEEISLDNGLTHSETLMPLIKKTFEEINLKLNDIDLIVCDKGPGSFTGIRIGVTIAKVYAWALKLDITTVSALEAMSISCEEETNHVPIIDARRGYVFAAIYDKDSNVIFKPKHILVEEFDKELEKLDDYVVISNNELERYDTILKYDPNISKIVEKVMNRKSVNPHAVNPEYLKLTEAEESRLNDNRV